MREGAVVGRYQIGRVIGRGGMAVVHAGEHRVLRYRVAVKVLHPDHLENPSMERRFLNEARALAAIRHPGIVELLDVGCAADGRAYLVMEMLEGISLAQRLARGPLPLPQAISFGRQLASALAAAHAKGIVHRDLKPDNILIVRDPDLRFGERVKILDFGIAKRTTEATPSPPITQTGIVVGTPGYMSPEQCRARMDVDGRSDIYTLGVVLYHMVTGHHPFEGETRELLARHMHAPAAPSPSRVDPAIPEAMSALIARCMARVPAARFPTMQAVKLELGRVELGEDTEVTPAAPEEDTATTDLDIEAVS